MSAQVSPERTSIIVGAGQAGGRAAEALRAEDSSGRVILIGDENYVPYERPPLSKKVLSAGAPIDTTFLKPPSFYTERRIELLLGTRAVAIDRAGRRVLLGDGRAVPYDRLLLATGSRLRRMALPGADLPGIFYLRGIDDSLTIREHLRPGTAAVVVGGGYIGLEVAAAARVRGCDVTVLETEDAVMSRVVAPEIGRIFAGMHRARGVDIRTGALVVGFEGDGRVERVQCANGVGVRADVVVVGIGVVPDTALAEGAGLEVDDGVVVDAFGRTSDPLIFAAGDVARHPNPLLGRALRLESWQHAQNHAIAVARNLCGREEPYAEVPWFWSDQHDLNLQMVGAPERWDRLVWRGDVAAGRWTAFYLHEDLVVAANAVNNARDIRPSRELIARRQPVDPDVLSDLSMPLKKLL